MDIPKKTPGRPALEGVTLEMIVTRLSEDMGWNKMYKAVTIRCFSHDPSIKSSLKFLRKTPWARTQVEQLYLEFTKARHA
jgi:uncharacterized protein (DUF2132 family)